MSISRRIATGTAGMALAVAGLLGGAAANVAPAVAAPATHHHHHHHPHQHCPTKHGKYPPGKCRVYFAHHHHKAGHHVAFKTGRVFKPGEKVIETLSCHGIVKRHHHKHKHKRHVRLVRHRTVRGRHSGEVFDTLKVPKHAHKTCRLVLRGHKSGIVLTRTFHVSR